MAASIIGKWKFVQPGIGLSVVLVMSADLSLGTALFLRPDQTLAQEPLLRTKWEQINGFEKYTPGQQRTGCWSTALAQIAFYHKLEPHGRVNYVCSDGQIINENLSSREFALADFQESITDPTPEDKEIQHQGDTRLRVVYRVHPRSETLPVTQAGKQANAN